MSVDLFSESAIAFSKGESADAIAVRKAQEAKRSLLLYRSLLNTAQEEALRARRMKWAEKLGESQAKISDYSRLVNRAIALIEEGQKALERNGVSDWSERLRRLEEFQISR